MYAPNHLLIVQISDVYCEVTPGHDAYGSGGYSVTTIYSVDECAFICKDHPFCTVFIYTMHNFAQTNNRNVCWLKSNGVIARML